MSNAFDDLERSLEEYRTEMAQKKRDNVVFRIRCFIDEHNYFTSYRWKDNPIHPRNIKHGLKALWFFRKVIWNYRPWDFVYALKIWEKTLEAQQIDFAQSFIGNSDKYIEDIYLARCLLKRLLQEDYETRAKGEFNPRMTSKFYYVSEKLRDNDLELFCKILQKHSRKWWT